MINADAISALMSARCIVPSAADDHTPNKQFTKGKKYDKRNKVLIEN
jgi:hypothetical protein